MKYINIFLLILFLPLLNSIDMQGMDDESSVTQRELFENFKKDRRVIINGSKLDIKNYVTKNLSLVYADNGGFESRVASESELVNVIVRLRLMNKFSEKIIEKRQEILNSKGIKDNHNLFNQEKNKAFWRACKFGAISILTLVSGLCVSLFDFDDRKYNVAGGISCGALSSLFFYNAFKNKRKATDKGQTEWLNQEKEKYEVIKRFIKAHMQVIRNGNDIIKIETKITDAINSITFADPS